jgi:hypothetical protein
MQSHRSSVSCGRNGLLQLGAVLLLPVATALMAVAAPASAAPVKVTVAADDVTAIAALIAAGAEPVADRAAYRVFRVDRAALGVRRLAPGLTLRADYDRIALRRRTIDTADSAAPTGAGSLTLGDPQASTRRLRLVQFSAPPTDDEVAALERTGARIVQYVPQNAYLVWSDTDSTAAAIRSRTATDSRFQYETAYLPSDALSPRLDRIPQSQADVDVTVQLYNHDKVKTDVRSVLGLASSVITAPSTEPRATYVNVRISSRDRAPPGAPRRAARIPARRTRPRCRRA